MGELFGALGQVGAASMNASAINQATQTQVAALQQQQQFVYNNLNPTVVNAQAAAADIQGAQASLALQGQIDPNLLAQRYASESASLGQLGAIANPNSNANQVSAAAAQNALSTANTSSQMQQPLINAALQQLQAGATLPPDVEAQLVQAGLEQSGMTTGGASGQGLGGQQLRTILGTAGIQLQQQRQQQAAQLSASAQNLETSRANILGSLFPNLTQQQLSTLGGEQSAFSQAAGAAPTVGLSGTNVANTWLARVGATNQLAQSAANVSAQGTMGQAQAWSNALGGASGAVGNAAGSALPLSTISGWLSGSGSTSSPTNIINGGGNLGTADLS
jgi:hypothetical protein